MALNPALLEMIAAAASAKHQPAPEPARGIIPLQTDVDPHDVAVFTVASMINSALTGPAVGIYELSERIVGEVDTILKGE